MPLVDAIDIVAISRRALECTSSAACERVCLGDALIGRTSDSEPSLSCGPKSGCLELSPA